MQWTTHLHHAIADPLQWLAGFLLMAGRVGERSLSVFQRLLWSSFPILLGVLVGIPGSFLGAYVAMRLEVQGLHAEDTAIRQAFQAEIKRIDLQQAERSLLRENQMQQFTKQCGETQARVGAHEARIGTLEREVARIQAREDLRKFR